MAPWRREALKARSERQGLKVAPLDTGGDFDFEEVDEAEVFKPEASPKLSIDAFQVGDTVNATVMVKVGQSGYRMWLNTTAYVMLEAQEMEDGFPQQPRLTIGEVLTCRIFEIDKAKKRIYVTRRTGSLKRLPRMVLRDTKKLDKSHFSQYARNQFFMGKVSRFAMFGVYVAVPAPRNGALFEGLLHCSEFSQDFNRTAVLGMDVAVRVKSVDRERLELSMNSIEDDF